MKKTFILLAIVVPLLALSQVWEVGTFNIETDGNVNVGGNLRVTNVVSVSSGSVSSPAVQFLGETNTGIYSSAAGRLNAAVLGTNVVDLQHNALSFRPTGTTTWKFYDNQLAAINGGSIEIPANGAAANRVWVCTNITTGAGHWSMAAHPGTNSFRLQDEFFGGGGTATTAGELGWAFASGTFTSVEEDNHPGTASWSASGGSGTIAYIYLGYGITAVSGTITNMVWDMGWGFNVADISQNIVRLGWLDNVNIVPVNGIYFSVTNTASAGTWFGITRNASTEAISQSSAVTCDAGWHEFRIKSDGIGNVTYYIDGALIATDSANLPTAGMRICLQVANTDGTSAATYLDWFDLRMDVIR
jgi:hypothetical protein